MKNSLILKTVPEIERPIDTWCECRGYEVLYSVNGSLDAVPNVGLDDSLAKQLSYTRLQRNKESYDTIGRLLAELNSDEGLSVNQQRADKYFNLEKLHTLCDVYVGSFAKYLVFADNNQTWYLPMSTIKFFAPKEQKTLSNNYSLACVVCDVPELDRLNDLSLTN